MSDSVSERDRRKRMVTASLTHFPSFLAEAWRVLKPEGLLLCKIVDYVHNHRYQWAHIDLIQAAHAIGFFPCDCIVKVRKGPIVDPKWKHAHHSRRQHCYLLVFKSLIGVSSKIKPPSAGRQVRFHQLLVAARKTWLMDALSDALMRVDPNTLKVQLSQFVPEDVQRLLAAAGVRDEHVFPTPLVLEAKPTLIGYYRLLLGLPQKTFYGRDSGMARFKRLEAGGALRPGDSETLAAFCKAMGSGLADLVRQMFPVLTDRDLAELPLLALGSQFQGSNNNAIGKQATLDVFLSIAEIVSAYIVERSDRILKVRNASKRVVAIALAGNPDVSVREEFDRQATQQGGHRNQRRYGHKQCPQSGRRSREIAPEG